MSSSPPPSWYSEPSGRPAPGSDRKATPARKRRGLLIAGSAVGTLVALGMIGNMGNDEEQPSGPATTTAVSSTTVITTTTAPLTTAATTPSTLSTEAPGSGDIVIVGPTGGDDSTQRDVLPPVLVPTPEVSVSQTINDVVPNAPAIAPFRSCSAARAAGAAPVYRSDPGYSSTIDRDGDGVACEGG